MKAHTERMGLLETAGLQEHFPGAFERAFDRASTLSRQTADLLGPTRQELVRRVVTRCEAMAIHLPLTAQETKRLSIAASLHRVGELCLPAVLARKCFIDMTSAELALYARYPLYSTLFLTEGKAGDPFFDLMLSHREYLSGAGFPGGLQAKTVPLEARVLCVATEYEELIMYRGGTPQKDDAIQRRVLSDVAGRYDPDLVKLLIGTVADRAGRH